MHLNQQLCHDYYCQQQSGGGPLFHGVAHQRGYGFFGDLGRYNTPFALRAGKYLGEKLLRTGSNVIDDITSGSSFKQAARTRLRETGKVIKDDILKKLQRGKGIKRKRSRQSRQTKAKPRKKVVKDIFS